jgi:hypothetical protein
VNPNACSKTKEGWHLLCGEHELHGTTATATDRITSSSSRRSPQQPRDKATPRKDFGVAVRQLHRGREGRIHRVFRVADTARPSACCHGDETAARLRNGTPQPVNARGGERHLNKHRSKDLGLAHGSRKRFQRFLHICVGNLCGRLSVFFFKGAGSKKKTCEYFFYQSRRFRV